MKKQIKVDIKKQNELLERILKELLRLEENLQVQKQKLNVVNIKPQRVNIFGLAEYLNESPQEIYLKVKRKELPYSKLKSQTIFDINEIDLFLNFSDNKQDTNC